MLLRVVGQVSVARYLLGVDAPSHLDASLGVAAHVGGEVVFAVPHALAHLVVAVGLLEVVLLDAEVGHVAEDLILRLPVGIFAAEGERLLVVVHALLVVEEVGIGVANQVVEFRDVGLLLTLLAEFHALHAQVERLDVAGAGDIELAHLHVGEDARLLLLLRHVRPEASADQRVEDDGLLGVACVGQLLRCFHHLLARLLVVALGLGGVGVVGARRGPRPHGDDHREEEKRKEA